VTGVSPRTEMALGPDLAADPLSWTWVNITHPTRTQNVVIRRGASGGANEVQPGTMSFLVANPGGIHTPGRADSPYYPNLKRGMPVRAVLTGQRDPYLALTGEASSRASTPDNAALDIVGDLSVAVEFECPLRVPPNETFWELATKWSEAANMSWRLVLSYDGSLIFQWTTGGTVATKLTFAGRLGVPRPDAGILTVGFYFDVNNGAAGRDIYWYVGRGATIDQLIASPATYLQHRQTDTGTTSIFSGTAPVEIGDNSGSTDNNPAAGKVRRAIIRSGTMDAGTIVANPVFTTQNVGATSFTDSATRVWTVVSPASIIDDHVRMMGELVSASPTWPGGPNDDAARVQWDVQGPLSRLRQGVKPEFSALYNKIANSFVSGNLLAYWPLEDGANSISGFSPIQGVLPLQVSGTGWEWAADSSNPASAPNPHVEGIINFQGQVPTSLRTIGQTQFRVDVMVKIPTPNASPSSTRVFEVQGTGTVKRWGFVVDDTNVGIIGVDAFNGVLVSTAAAVNANFFGPWCLWSFDLTQNGGNIDWSLSVVPSTTGTATVYSGSLAGNVSRCTGVMNWSGSAPSSGGISFGHIAVSQGLGLGWIAPADTAYRGEPAGRRFHRLCQENGLQPLVDGVYGLHWDDVQTAGAKPMGEQRPGTLLGLLEECALVENARIGESRELRGLTFRSQHVNQSPALTITYELGHPFVPVLDNQQLVNDVTVSMPGGTSHREIDQASIDDSDVYDDTRTVNTETPLQLPDLAGWWLHEGTWPGMRVPVLRVELGRTPAFFDAWMATSFGDLIRAAQPPNGFPESPLDVLLDGYLEELSKFHWGLSVNVSPAGPWQVGVRNSSTLGIRDTGGSVLNSSFAAGTATSMSVATTLGPLWAVTAASNSALPFDVNVGGYRITVTAIGAAAGSVQTFTVSTAIVNGLPARTIAAGSAVSVWRPARRAF